MTEAEAEGKQNVWIAADYHNASGYSCRMPMSSMSSTLTMPAPSPSMIRLASIRNAIELFGYHVTRNELFPIIRSAKIFIKPPYRIGISNQKLRAYKASSKGGIGESIVYREFAQCEGNITVYINVPKPYKSLVSKILKAISYWGQANCFTSCLNTSEKDPLIGECAIALEELEAPFPLQDMFSCFVTEFLNEEIEWEAIMPSLDSGKTTFLKTVLYLWPLMIEQHGTSKLLLWRSIIFNNKQHEK